MLSEVKLLIPASIRSAYAGEQITGTNLIYDSNWNNNAGATQDVINNSLKYAIDNIDVDLSGYYQKPNSGIPKSDLADNVKTTLTNADTAYITALSAYQKPSSGIPKIDLAASIGLTLSNADELSQYYKKPGTTSELNSYSNLQVGTVAFDKTKGELVQYKNNSWKNVDTLDFDINTTVEDIPAAESNYVSYAAQGDKTPQQKAQARANIGAIDSTELQAAISQIPSGGGTIVLPIDTSWVDNSLNAVESRLIATRFAAIESQIPNKANKSETVSNVTYANGTLNKTINGTTTPLFSAENILAYCEAKDLEFRNDWQYNDLLYITDGNNVDECLAALDHAIQEKQELLDSGVNIKTINNQSLLGSGNIDISIDGDYITTSTFNNTVSSLNTTIGTKAADTNVVHKTNNVAESINGNKSFSGNTEFGIASSSSASKTTINGSVIVPNYAADGILTVVEDNGDNNKHKIVSDTNAYSTLQDLTTQPYMVYRGSLSEYSELPGSNTTKIGDTYFVEELNSLVMAKNVTQNKGIYVNIPTYSSLSERRVEQFDTDPQRVFTYAGFLDELDAIYSNQQTVTETFGNYPQIPYNYHDFSSNVNDNIRVVLVKHPAHGYVIYIITELTKKLFVVSDWSDGEMNTWYIPQASPTELTLTDLANQLIKVTFDDLNLIYDPAKINAGIGIKGFYTFGGGVEWTRPNDTSTKTVNGMSLQGKGNVLITPSNSVTSATSGHITDIILNISNAAANNTIEYEDLDTMIQYGFIPVLCDENGQCYHLSKIVKGSGGSDYYEFSELVYSNNSNFEFRVRRCNSATGPDWTYGQHSFTI